MIAEFKGEHRWLSNFWPCTVKYKDVLFPSSEHAYVMAKVEPHLWPAVLDLVLEAKTAGQVKRLGRKLPLRPDWDLVKVQVMRDILESKFSNTGLAAMLLTTGDEELVEGNHWGDTFWGVCDGVGQNWLGRLLMGIRADLASKRASPEAP